MIQKLEISGVHASIDNDLRKYVVKKIGKLDQYMSRHVRVSAHAEVKLKEAMHKTRKQATCEVLVYLPHDVITTQETSLNMYASIDIVEEKLKNQLKKYKELHAPKRIHRQMLERMWHRPSQYKI